MLGMKKMTKGFTLVEMAIVLLVVTLLLGGLLVPLTTQIEQRKISETQKFLADAKEALIGFAIANGRLPCPASSASNGLESYCTDGNPLNACAPTPVPQNHGRCSNFFDGFLPAVTLGLSNVDSSGYAVDGWGLVQNRIRYAVTTSSGNAFTSSASKFGNQSILDLAKTLATSPFLGLHVCSTAATLVTIPPSNMCAATLTDNAIAVVFSLGKNAPTGGTSPDEKQNLDNDLFFVSHVPSSVTGSEFDDIVDWLSPNILFNRAVAAGTLP